MHMSMRHMLSAGLATWVLAGGMALAQENRDLILGATLEPPSLDPTTEAAAAVDEVTYANIFEGLTSINANGAVEPGLATGWEISDDGLTYTFTLMEGVQFSDGTDFTAEDVVFTLNRVIGEDSVSSKATLFAAIESVEALGDYTVQLNLSRPEGLLLFNLGVGDAAIVAPESIDQIATNPVGTGPYVIGDRTEGDRITLTRNEHYDREAPYFDTVTIRYITDPAAQTAAVLSGDVHVFTNIGAPEALGAFEADPRFEVMVGTTEGETVMSANWRREPFDNPLVRQAIMHAIDRQGIVDTAMFGYGTPIGTHFAPHNPDYLDLTDVYPYDPDRARELLAEAGLADGFEATLMLPPPTYARRGGEVIQGYLADVGIEVELIPVEWGQWLEEAFRGYEYDMTIVSHTEANDIGIYARGPDDYYFGYDSVAFNAVIDELGGETDPAARTELNQAAQRMIAEDLSAIFLFQLPQLGVRDVRVHGMWENRPIQANDVTGAYWEE